MSYPKLVAMFRSSNLFTGEHDLTGDMQYRIVDVGTDLARRQARPRYVLESNVHRDSFGERAWLPVQGSISPYELAALLAVIQAAAEENDALRAKVRELQQEAIGLTPRGEVLG